MRKQDQNETRASSGINIRIAAFRGNLNSESRKVKTGPEATDRWSRQGLTSFELAAQVRWAVYKNFSRSRAIFFSNFFLMRYVIWTLIRERSKESSESFGGKSEPKFIDVTLVLCQQVFRNKLNQLDRRVR